MREYIRHITTPTGENLACVVMGESHKNGIDTYGIYTNNTVFTYKESNKKFISLNKDIENIIFSRFDRMLIHLKTKKWK